LSEIPTPTPAKLAEIGKVLDGDRPVLCKEGDEVWGGRGISRVYDLLIGKYRWRLKDALKCLVCGETYDSDGMCDCLRKVMKYFVDVDEPEQTEGAFCSRCTKERCEKNGYCHGDNWVGVKTPAHAPDCATEVHTSCEGCKMEYDPVYSSCVSSCIQLDRTRKNWTPRSAAPVAQPATHTSCKGCKDYLDFDPKATELSPCFRCINYKNWTPKPVAQTEPQYEYFNDGRPAKAGDEIELSGGRWVPTACLPGQETDPIQYRRRIKPVQTDELARLRNAIGILESQRNSFQIGESKLKDELAACQQRCRNQDAQIENQVKMIDEQADAIAKLEEKIKERFTVERPMPAERKP
jgi:hypothetical protein